MFLHGSSAASQLRTNPEVQAPLDLLAVLVRPRGQEDVVEFLAADHFVVICVDGRAGETLGDRLGRLRPDVRTGDKVHFFRRRRKDDQPMKTRQSGVP